jgi:anti-anti-sigma regulatory factor
MGTHNAQTTIYNTIRYAFENGIWFIKCVGDICHPLGPTLNALVEQAITHPESKNFVIDLTEAKIIDSTCLGLLTRLATRSNVGKVKPIIITGGGNIAKSMLTVRFDLLFKLVDSLDNTPQSTQAAPCLTMEQNEMLQLLLDAHRRLCAIDSETHNMFKDVVAAFEAL